MTPEPKVSSLKTQIKEITMRLLTLAIALLALAGCNDPVQRQSTLPTSNPHADVDVLFESEEFKLFRFKDGPNTVYVAIPHNSRTAYAAQLHQVQDGEHNSHIETVPSWTTPR